MKTPNEGKKEMKEDCPMKGRMSQCSAKEKCIHNQKLMKTPSEIHHQGQEELKKISDRIQDLVWQIEKCGASEDLTKAVIMAGEIKQDIRNSTSQALALLQSVKEWAEKNAKEISDAYSFNIKYNYSDFISLTDLITFLKEQEEIIKKI